MKPTIIVHYHVYKNAGSSVDASIRDCVGADAFIELDKDKRYKEGVVYNSDLVKNVLNDLPEMRGFSSHTFVSTVHRSDAFRAIPIVFLRHPLLRLASVYRFEAKSPAHMNTPSGLIAQKAGFAEWLEAYLDMYNGKNFQTCVLSMDEDGSHSPFTNDHPRHIGDIKVATERLDEINEITGVGIVEDFEGSARRIEERIQKDFPSFNLTSSRKNMTKSVKNWRDEVAILKADLTKSLYVEAITRNSSDYALYERYR